MEDQDQHITHDKCLICGWCGKSSDTIETINHLGEPIFICPCCGSEDLDDINANPYDDDDDWEDGDQLI